MTFLGRYEEFNNLKLVNPNLKTMLAVGGNFFQSKKSYFLKDFKVKYI